MKLVEWLSFFEATCNMSGKWLQIQLVMDIESEMTMVISQWLIRTQDKIVLYSFCQFAIQNNKKTKLGTVTWNMSYAVFVFEWNIGLPPDLRVAYVKYSITLFWTEWTQKNLYVRYRRVHTHRKLQRCFDTLWKQEFWCDVKPQLLQQAILWNALEEWWKYPPWIPCGITSTVDCKRKVGNWNEGHHNLINWSNDFRHFYLANKYVHFPMQHFVTWFTLSRNA